ncbi:hypothetical protein BRADI_1g16795v3 [Brachypodium distachyon]|uniref:Uncharacterized protein n=1 Tax=Brachypodium distachyon TaxID=15368 RepID=A0A2K2DJS6_BRADI|nr:hypothetical protein BRADI_1g16795v3 [Brachypodium distachyon]
MTRARWSQGRSRVSLQPPPLRLQARSARIRGPLHRVNRDVQGGADDMDKGKNWLFMLKLVAHATASRYQPLRDLINVVTETLTL